jgi:hypothetical protein
MSSKDLPFNDSLDDILPMPAGYVAPAPQAQPPREPAKAAPIAGTYLEAAAEFAAKPKLHKCHACHGTGTWVSPTGRFRGPCHACKAKGGFKSSPEQRAKDKVYAQKVKARNAQVLTDAIVAWKAANSEAFAWMMRNANSFEFALNMVDALTRYGSLTPGQVDAVNRCVAREKVRDEARATAPDQGTGLDLRGLVSGRYAVPGGDTRLKVQIDVCTEGKWAGWVFVKDGAGYGQGQRYGAQRPNQTYVGKIESELRAIAANPFEASKAYGRLVGACGVCGRKLEDETSVANGIGPVCASKF